jgi:hypothetical protein
MSQDPFIETALGPRSAEPAEAIVVGLLRRVASELTTLVQSPSQFGDEHHSAAALHAVHRALIELEPLAQRERADDGPWPLP